MDSGPAAAILLLLAERKQPPVTPVAEELDRHPVTVDRQCWDLQRAGESASRPAGARAR
jgi:DNA-binding IclR family transcriptional regulator